MHRDIGGIDLTVVDHRGAQRDGFTLVGQDRVDADVADLHNEVGCGGAVDRQGLDGAVVIFAALRDHGVGIDQHLDLAGAFFVGSVVGHLGRGAAARRNRGDGLLGTDGGHGAISHIDKLHQHFTGIERPGVEDGDGHTDGFAIARIGRRKADVLGQHHQIGRGGRGDGQGGRVFVVDLVQLTDKVVGIDNDANPPLACTSSRGGGQGASVKDHLYHAAATGGDHVNGLLFADGQGATGANVSKLYDHPFRRRGAIVENNGGQGDDIALFGLGRGKADRLGHHLEVGQRRGGDRQGFAGVVVPFVAFRDQVVGIDLHLDLAVFHFAIQSEGGLHLGAATERDQVDKLFAANRGGDAGGHVDKLDEDAVGIDGAIVQDDSAQGDFAAVGRFGGVEVDVAGQDQQVRQRRRLDAHTLLDRVVQLVGFGDGVAGVNHDLDQPFAGVADRPVSHLDGAAAAGGNRGHLLFVTNWRGAAVCDIDKLRNGRTGVGVAVVDNGGVNRNRLADQRFGRVKADIGRLHREVGGGQQGDLERLFAGVVGLFRFGQEVVRVDDHLDLAVAGFTLGVIGDFGNAAATGGDHLDGLLFTDGGGGVVGAIDKLHQHIARFGVAIVEDGGAQGDNRAGGRVIRLKTDVGLEHHQIGRRGRNQAQPLFGGIVALARLGQDVIGIDGDANVAVAAETGGVVGDLQGGAAAGRDDVDDLEGANRDHAGAGAVGNLHLDIGGVGAAIVADGGVDRHLIAGASGGGVKADVGGFNAQVGRRAWGDGEGRFGAVVGVAHLWHKVAGIDDDLDLAVAQLAGEIVGDINGAAAAGGNGGDGLGLTNRHRLTVGDIGHIDSDIVGFVAAIVEDDGMDGNLVAFDRVQRVKANIFAADDQVCDRLLFTGAGQFGDLHLDIINIPAFKVVKAVVNGIKPEADMDNAAPLDVGREADRAFDPGVFGAVGFKDGLPRFAVGRDLNTGAVELFVGLQLAPLVEGEHHFIGIDQIDGRCGEGATVGRAGVIVARRFLAIVPCVGGAVGAQFGEVPE